MDTSARLSRLAGAVHLRCRGGRWGTYVAEFPPREGESVLDVGVSPLVDLPGENHFLSEYPFPGQVTAVSNDTNLASVRDAFPQVRVLTADGRDLPFADRAFDIVHSNAVIEHVGPAHDQARFLAELVRVGSAGFISTPSRWFPVDSHTNLPFLHWLPRGAFVGSLRRLGRVGQGEEWITWLLSRRAFEALVPPSVEYKLVTQRLAGLSAVATLVFRHPPGRFQAHLPTSRPARRPPSQETLMTGSAYGAHDDRQGQRGLHRDLRVRRRPRAAGADAHRAAADHGQRGQQAARLRVGQPAPES